MKRSIFKIAITNVFILIQVAIGMSSFCQVLSNNGSTINILPNTVITSVSLDNTAGTITNNGTLALTSNYSNSATITGDGIYNIGGNWTNTGSFTQGLGMVSFNGSGAQSIGTASFKNVTFAGGNTKTVTGNIFITETINLEENTTLDLSSNIIIKSTATATARVTAIPSTATITYGSGKFVVERYIPGRRKYRLITSSVTTSTANSLTAGQEALSIWGNWQNQGVNTANTGTIITGGSSANGFDQQTSNASLYTYDEINRKYTGFSTANGKNTKYTPLKAGIAYYMFVYGDRTNSVSTNTPNFTTISAAGTILKGDQTYNTSSAIPLTNTTGNYTMLGNPYASPIDWATVTKTNISNTYWGWDPNLSSTGGYVTVSTTGTVTLISPFTGTTGLNQYIQSGQGFFVRTTATSPQMIIKESDKVSNYNTNAFRTSHENSIPLIAINLFDAGKNLMDGTLSAFSKGFSNDVKHEDAQKLAGSGEMIAVAIGKELLSIDARKLPAKDDTIFIKTEKLTKKQYILQVFTNGLDTLPIQPYLHDKYLNSIIVLSKKDTNLISFNVTADATSFSADRFKILFDNAAVTITNPPVNSELKVFPNPVKNKQINLKVNDLDKGQYKIQLYDQQAKKIFDESFDHAGGSFNRIIFINQKIARGIYHLFMSGGSKQFTHKIMVE